MKKGNGTVGKEQRGDRESHDDAFSLRLVRANPLELLFVNSALTSLSDEINSSNSIHTTVNHCQDNKKWSTTKTGNTMNSNSLVVVFWRRLVKRNLVVLCRENAVHEIYPILNLGLGGRFAVSDLNFVVGYPVRSKTRSIVGASTSTDNMSHTLFLPGRDPLVEICVVGSARDDEAHAAGFNNSKIRTITHFFKGKKKK